MQYFDPYIVHNDEQANISNSACVFCACVIVYLCTELSRLGFLLLFIYESTAKHAFGATSHSLHRPNALEFCLYQVFSSQQRAVTWPALAVVPRRGYARPSAHCASPSTANSSTCTSPGPSMRSARGRHGLLSCRSTVALDRCSGTASVVSIPPVCFLAQ